MKLFGWALILAGGGLVAYGVRKLSAPSAEPGDPDYDETDMTEEEFDAQYLHHRDDLNDGV